ncbi:MAG TPA: hypothetical protein VK902_06065, partial [Rubrobacter sp.]|nr:hypothetical protein [Rubrobacter sp.]
MRKLVLLAGLCMLGVLTFGAVVWAQEDGGAITARGADTVPLNPDGTCPPGYVTVNAPFCAEESPNTPGRIFGYGEGDLAPATPGPVEPLTAAPTATATPGPVEPLTAAPTATATATADATGGTAELP